MHGSYCYGWLRMRSVAGCHVGRCKELHTRELHVDADFAEFGFAGAGFVGTFQLLLELCKNKTAWSSFLNTGSQGLNQLVCAAGRFIIIITRRMGATCITHRRYMGTRPSYGSLAHSNQPQWRQGPEQRAPQLTKTGRKTADMQVFDALILMGLPAANKQPGTP